MGATRIQQMARIGLLQQVMLKVSSCNVHHKVLHVIDWRLLAAADPNPKTIHCIRVYWEPKAKAALMQYK